jgi:ketosteroid isomerase-like protein
MNDMSAVKRAVDRLLTGALGPLLDLLAKDVEFEVVGGGDVPGCMKDRGNQPVVDYFTALGGLVAFWQMDYTATGQRVIAWGKESFTVEHSGLEGGCEFALVFDLSDGMIARLLVVEDLRPVIPRDYGLQTGRNSSARLRTNGSTAPEGRHSRRSRSIAGKSSAGDQTSTIRSSPSTTQ